MALYWILLIFISLSLVIGLVRFSQHSVPGKILCWLILLGFLSQSIGLYLGKRIFASYHIFFVLQYILATVFFYYSFTNKKHKKVILLLLLPVITLAILNTLYFQKIHTYPSNFALITHSIFLVCSLILYLQMFDAPVKLNLFKQSIFWSASAFLVFPVLMLLSLGLYNYFERRKLDGTFINIAFYVANYIFYSLLSLSLWFDRQKMN